MILLSPFKSCLLCRKQPFGGVIHLKVQVEVEVRCIENGEQNYLKSLKKRPKVKHDQAIL